jgi:hypothetical protein
MPELECVPGLTLFPGDATENDFRLFIACSLKESREEEWYLDHRQIGLSRFIKGENFYNPRRDVVGIIIYYVYITSKLS